MLRLMVVCGTADSGGEAVDHTIELWWVGVMTSHCIMRTRRIRSLRCCCYLFRIGLDMG